MSSFVYLFLCSDEELTKECSLGPVVMRGEEIFVPETSGSEDDTTDQEMDQLYHIELASTPSILTDNEDDHRSNGEMSIDSVEFTDQNEYTNDDLYVPDSDSDMSVGSYEVDIYVSATSSSSLSITSYESSLEEINLEDSNSGNLSVPESTDRSSSSSLNSYAESIYVSESSDRSSRSSVDSYSSNIYVPESLDGSTDSKTDDNEEIIDLGPTTTESNFDENLPSDDFQQIENNEKIADIAEIVDGNKVESGEEYYNFIFPLLALEEEQLPVVTTEPVSPGDITTNSPSIPDTEPSNHRRQHDDETYCSIRR